MGEGRAIGKESLEGNRRDGKCECTKIAPKRNRCGIWGLPAHVIQF